MTSDPALSVRVAEARRFGWTWASIERRGSTDEERSISDLLERSGLRPPESALRRVLRDVAERLLTDALAADLAYGRPTMAAAVAAEIARDFLAAFSVDATYMTNRSADADTWDPVTTHTFDALIAAVDSDTVGFICVADED